MSDPYAELPHVWINGIEVSTDGKRLIVQTMIPRFVGNELKDFRQRIKLYSLPDQEQLPLRHNETHGLVGACFSGDGSQLLVHCLDEAALWDVARDSPELTARFIDGFYGSNPVFVSAWHAFAASSYDGVSRWALSKKGVEKNNLVSMTGEHFISTFAVSPNGIKVAYVETPPEPPPPPKDRFMFPVPRRKPQPVRVVDLKTNTSQLLRPRHSSFAALAFYPDGKQLCTGGGKCDLRMGELEQAAELKIWSTALGDLEMELIGHTRKLFSVAYSSDGQFLASGGLDGARIWNLADRTSRPLEGIEGMSSNGLAFLPDGKTLAAANCSNATVTFHDATNGKVIQTLRIGKA